MILSPDALLPEGPSRWQPHLVAEAFAHCHRTLRDSVLLDPSVHAVGIVMGAAGSGKSTWARLHDESGVVLMDAVWATAGKRAGLASRISQMGKRSVCVWLRTSLATCRSRNAAREAWRRVPEDALLRSWREIETNPPCRAEGWSHVEIVDGEVRS